VRWGEKIAAAERIHDSRMPGQHVVRMVKTRAFASCVDCVNLAAIMRFVAALSQSLLVLSSVIGVAQAPESVSPLPTDPAEVFKAAQPLYDFASPKLRPWHMKVSYELFDEKEKSKGKGSFEYWWESPDTYRSTWTRGAIKQTDWHLAGKIYHAGTGDPLDFDERKLEADLVAPLPIATELDPQTATYHREDQAFSGVKLPCVMVMRKMPPAGKAESPMGMFPTYCFDPQHPLLHLSYIYGSTSAVYNNVIRMQGMYLPRQVSVLENKRKVLIATVDTIDALAPNPPALKPSEQAVVVDETQRVEVKGDVMQALLRRQVKPYYPIDASSRSIQGSVKLKAVIGPDGRVREIHNMDGPTESMMAAATWAVWQWEYQPYFVNGVPVTVETTIDLNMHIGR
jgi:Gram-negative bacterial TonB protein C-terminal